MRSFLVLLSVLLLLSPQAFARESLRVLEGAVLRVSDEDTINIDSGGTKVKIRFYGIDTPETEKINRRTGQVSKPGQPYGDEACHALESKIANQRVRVEVMDRDRYGRLVSVVWLDNRNINKEMVADGWAWAYRQYLDRPHASEYIDAEERARARRLGLWRQSNPQPPWEFRKMLKM
ncbi:MAG: nuclease [Deltaproteobacteria bacterium]|nr:nuclease [Deltaproteobacteria bacterium]TLN00630.1 MAG: nuclease [bacterium]